MPILKVMLDTNAFDEIYVRGLKETLSNATSSGKVQFYITQIQANEISKVVDEVKRSYILSVIESVPVVKLLTSGGRFGTARPTRVGFTGSSWSGFSFGGTNDAAPLNRFQRQHRRNPMGNSADLLIANTAVQQKCDYLVSSNAEDFKNVIAALNTEYSGNVQLIDIARLLVLLGVWPKQRK